MIRVLHVIGIMDRGGAETMIMNLYRHIDRNRIQFDFVVHTGAEGAFDQEINRLGGKIYHCPGYILMNHISYVRWWKGFFNARGRFYSIVHGHIGSTAAVYLRIAKKHGLYTIAHSHNTNGSLTGKELLYRMLSYRTRFTADYFFACSRQAGIDRYGKGILRQKERFKVFPNAINTAAFSFDGAARRRVREQLDIKEGTLLLGHVGRFQKVKNHRFIVQVFYSLLQEGDRLHKDHKKVFPNLVSAYFLKWIQEGWVKVEKDPKHEQRVNLRFVHTGNQFPLIEDPIENKVYNSAREAAGDDLLEANEFKKWSYQHDTTVTSWPTSALKEGRKGWEAASAEERCHAVEFKNFLEDFTLADEREAPEVGVWKQYLILASVLGVAEQVMKNFEKLFPKLLEQYNRQTNTIDSVTTYYILRSLNHNSESMMASAINHQNQREAARAAAQRRSSGGGGSISFGGGGGGYGGGHGGGSR